MGFLMILDEFYRFTRNCVLDSPHWNKTKARPETNADNSHHNLANCFLYIRFQFVFIVLKYWLFLSSIIVIIKMLFTLYCLTLVFAQNKDVSEREKKIRFSSTWINEGEIEMRLFIEWKLDGKAKPKIKSWHFMSSNGFNLHKESIFYGYNVVLSRSALTGRNGK